LAAIVNRSSPERLRGAASWLVTAVAAIILPLAAGFGFARLFAPTLHSRYFPWITGRALGIAGFISLSALVALGIWTRHPWRLRRPLIHSETRLRLHASVATATVALVAGHLVALATDRYAGVGWIGAFVPGLSRYRTFAVALGVIALFSMILLFVSARAAGRRGARHWSAIHRFAILTYVLVWFHGVLAGADTTALRGLYVATAVGIGTLAVTRYSTARSPAPAPSDIKPVVTLVPTRSEPLRESERMLR
jgi:DMSO/TMAO reductase YedYZ heme-binding membrane subunit